MKNIDLNKLSKSELIKGITRLTLHTNKLLKSRGCNNTHSCYSESTLRNKSREYVEECFEHAWDWLREEIRANYGILDVDVDKAAIDELKKRLNDKQEENYKEYFAEIERGTDTITELVRELAANIGILCAFPDIKDEDIEAKINSDECIVIKLKNCFGGDINYYHRRPWMDEKDEDVKDEINFGTIGAFGIDSLRGHQQLFQMNLLSHLGSNMEIRSKMNGILDTTSKRNMERIRTNAKINTELVKGLDEIMSPYINKVAMGEIE